MVLADAEFDSERNHRYVRQQLGAMSVVLTKRGKTGWRLRGYQAQTRTAFPSCVYRRQQALAESVFSAVKRKLSARAPGRTLQIQRVQALLLGLAYKPIQAQTLLGLKHEPRLLGGCQQSQIACKHHKKVQFKKNAPRYPCHAAHRRDVPVSLPN